MLDQLSLTYRPCLTMLVQSRAKHVAWVNVMYVLVVIWHVGSRYMLGPVSKKYLPSGIVVMVHVLVLHVRRQTLLTCLCFVWSGKAISALKQAHAKFSHLARLL